MSTELDLAIVDKTTHEIVWFQRISNSSRGFYCLKKVRQQKTPDIDCDTHQLYKLTVKQAKVLLDEGEGRCFTVDFASDFENLKKQFDNSRYQWQVVVS